MLLPINPNHPEPRKIERAVDALERGEVIAYPTDTVYGLGCDLFNKKAIDRIYQIKQIPKDQKLTFICPDLGDIARYAIIDNSQYRLLRRVLPGPYTFILEATREVPKIVQSKRKTVGIRVPSHPVVQALVQKLGRPLITSSAVEPGGGAMIDPQEIDNRFKGIAMVLDGGVGGIEMTTVVNLSQDGVEVIREGAGSLEVLFG